MSTLASGTYIDGVVMPLKILVPNVGGCAVLIMKQVSLLLFSKAYVPIFVIWSPSSISTIFVPVREPVPKDVTLFGMTIDCRLLFLWNA